MKKFLLTMCVALLSVIAFAQYNVIVELIDGTEVKYSAKNVKNIRIEKGDSTQTEEEVVDAATLDFTFFILNDKEAEVTGLNIASGIVRVPAKVKIKGKVYTVTSIGKNAFDAKKESSMAKIKEIVLPNTITAIEEYAFSRCTSLTSIEIPNSVTSIGGSAFYECSGLTSIEIPNSVTEIYWYAFYGCKNLKEARVPVSLKGKVDKVFPDTCEIEWY